MLSRGKTTAFPTTHPIMLKQPILFGTLLCVSTFCCLFMYMHIDTQVVFGRILKAQYTRCSRDCTSVRTTAEPAETPFLLDVKESQLLGWTSKGVIESTSMSNVTNGFHHILWFNLPVWLNITKIDEQAKTCRFNNCKHTVNKNVLKSSSAIIFSMSDSARLTRPPLKGNERPSNQVWIYFLLESPATQEVVNKGVIPRWSNSFNWSMTYQLDSDIVFPYGVLTTKTFVEHRNFSEVFQRKSKWAAWLVSHCDVPSFRGRFVNKLKNHGLPVDIFGHCGKRLTTDPKKLISGEYKFYLSFENTMCKDYVTEKFFRYFMYDTILVVRGGADYKKLFPKKTFIDTADFASYESLVRYLTLIGNNENLYTTYLRNMARYKTTEFMDHNLPYCALCTKLNNIDIYKKSYTRIHKNLDKCYIPGDVERLDG